MKRIVHAQDVHEMEGFFAAVVNQIFWFFLIYSFLAPIIKQRMLEAARLQAIAAFEKTRGSRVIAMIHRQEALALFGIPVFRYINIEDAEDLLRVVRMTPRTALLTSSCTPLADWCWQASRLRAPCATTRQK